ncbi:SacI homology domain-containing protein [Neocallimastix sp. 'constans']
MECCVYIKQEYNNLRQVIITQKNINNGYALILYQHYSVMNNMYVANYLPVSALNLDDCKCYSDGIYGCLGLICVKDVTQIDNLGVFDGKTIYRITEVSFISLNHDLYDYYLDKKLQALIQDEESNISFETHPCYDLIKYLSRGTFYYSNDFDLTHCAQNRFFEIGTKNSLSYLENANSNFFWNKYLLKELLNFRKHLLDIEKLELDRSGILLVVIQGFVSISNIRTVDEEAQMCLISRLSCKRVGTRYNARGIDDDGNVANYVESEILFHNYEYYFSFLLIRGSVPLFWEQPQTAQMTHKIELSRGMESTAPAFKRHFEKMIKKYGHVYIINLLSRKEGSGENFLGQEYDKHFRNSPKSIKNYLNKLDFDFHEEYKSGEYRDCEEIIRTISNDLENYSYFLMKNNEIVSKQLGVVRVNCLDCLDRTNVVQTYIALYVFRKFFYNENNANYCSLVYGDDNFKTVFKNIWADNGDSLSRIYAGTGALKSSITRKGKQTVLGYLNDAKKSINRFVNNAFFDKSRQETINLLLGRFDNQKDVILHDPLSDAVQAKLQKQIHKFSSKGSITIFAGTWNVNGRPPPSYGNEDIYQWLYPDDDKLPDIYVIGIEEIVELTPQQVMSTDPEKRQIWENEILKFLKKLDSSYIHLKSKQLVGAFIAVYIRDKDVDKIRNVESVLIKTGLKGLAGNKGGVAISMNYCDSSLCFVTAHLAAGQQNIEDRNRDYNTISEGINFKGGRKIKDHDIVIWTGDFNYRIDLPNEYVRQKAYIGDLEELLNSDQLINQMLEGKAFYGYQEGPITFQPTYKYDIGTDEYDSSEKARIPAWCDRILFKAKHINQKYYKSTTNLRTSDHKPVKSLFDVEITIIDKEIKRNIEKELYNKQLDSYKKSQANGMIYRTNPFLDDDSDDTEIYPEPKIASSETSHWWDLRLLNDLRSPDTFSISSNDSIRTDVSPVHSINSTFTAVNNSYTSSNLVNEIATFDSGTTLQTNETNSISSHSREISVNTSDTKSINPFASELDEIAENSPSQILPKPIRTYTRPHQPPKPKKRGSQSSSNSSRPSSRPSSVYSDSNNGSKVSSPIRPLSSISASNATNSYKKSFKPAVKSSIVASPTSANSSNIGTPSSSLPSTPKPPKPAPPPPRAANKTADNKQITPSSIKNVSSSKPAPTPPKPRSKTRSETPKSASSSPKSGPKPTISPKPEISKLGNSSVSSSTPGTPKPAIAPKPDISKLNSNSISSSSPGTPKPAIAPKPDISKLGNNYVSSSSPGTPKPIVKQIINKVNSNSTLASSKIPPKPAAKPNSLLKSNNTNIKPSSDEINSISRSSTSSSINSLINRFNSNSIKNENDDKDNNEDNKKTITNTTNSTKIISSSLAKAFTVGHDENDESNSTEKELVVRESNIKPSDLKNGIFNVYDNNEEKKSMKSSNITKKKQPPPIPPKKTL